MKNLAAIWKHVSPALGPVGAIALLVVAALSWNTMNAWVIATLAHYRQATGLSHDHSAAHAATETAVPTTKKPSIRLSAQGLRNLGLTAEALVPLQPRNFRRSIAIPAIIVGRPGRTQVQVSAPLTGLVTHVHAVAGEAVIPGTLLFELRLTHEDLVQAQTDFLKLVGERDVEVRELARLKERFSESSAIPEKTLLEHEYNRDKLDAMLAAQREALKLHGLSERQVEEISSEKRLLRELQLVAPNVDVHDEAEELRLTELPQLAVAYLDDVAPPNTQLDPADVVLTLEELHVVKGQAVAAGEQLCTLADYSKLFIEGDAFEQDTPLIAKAQESGWPMTGVLTSGNEKLLLPDLSMMYIDHQIDRENRSLHFYVELKNELIRERTNAEGQRFVSWRYRPGQRLQLLVPVEEWTDQFVLPAEAVVREGAEAYVFRQNGNNFVQTPVHIRYRDQLNVVIENDGSVPAGAVIAQRSAHQLQMAVKNAAGGGVDPHAGHNH